MDVRIEPSVQHGKTCWKVLLGRRALVFQEELAARTFAAQLHLRLRWLHEQEAQHNGDQRPR